MLFKVVATSINRNAFGLRSMVVIGTTGAAWEMASNDLNFKPEGHIFDLGDCTNIGAAFTSRGYEIPSRKVPDPPMSVVMAAWPGLDYLLTAIDNMVPLAEEPDAPLMFDAVEQQVLRQIFAAMTLEDGCTVIESLQNVETAIYVVDFKPASGQIRLSKSAWDVLRQKIRRLVGASTEVTA